MSSNAFSAADMTTAAANGHRDGYQAGYEDAVKAFDAAQPAAAQEAVPYGYVFTDDPAKFAMPGSGFHFGPVPPTDAINVVPLYAAPVAAAPVDAPSIESAHAMGAKGAPANDAERLAFEAWMRGHCWALCATWDGAGYRSDAEQGGGYCPNAARTRMLWAAWRDRAALASNPAAPGIDLTAAEVGVIETLLALAYAVWNAADNGEDNGESLAIERSDFAAVDKALDALEELPDDQPGYAMEAAAKARWALRRVLSAPLIDASPNRGSEHFQDRLAEIEGRPRPEPEVDEVEEVATCLGDDAAAMLDENPEDERALNMQRAAELLTALQATSAEVGE